MALLHTQKHKLGEFAQWYWLLQPLRIIRGYHAYARVLLEIIPFGFLLLTLLQPWKNIRDKKTEHGFDLERAAERLALNMLSRCTGAVVRILTMILALVLHIMLLAASFAYLALWITFPLLATVGCILLLRSLVF